MLNTLAISPNRVCLRAGRAEGPKDAFSVARKFGSPMAMFLLALIIGQVSAETTPDTHINFVNVADNSGDLSQFSQFPAINNGGAVAFVGRRNGSGQAIFKIGAPLHQNHSFDCHSPYISFIYDVTKPFACCTMRHHRRL